MTTSRASSVLEMISISMPISSCTRVRNASQLAAWRHAYAWFVLSITLFTYFLFWNERLFLLPWHAESWMRAIIIVPALAAAIALGLRTMFRPNHEWTRMDTNGGNEESAGS